MSRGALDRWLASLARQDLGDLDDAARASIPGGPVFARHTDELGAPTGGFHLREDISAEALMHSLHDPKALEFYRSLPVEQQIALEAKIAEVNPRWADAFSNTVVLGDKPPAPPMRLPSMEEGAPPRGGNDIRGVNSMDTLERRLMEEASDELSPGALNRLRRQAADVRDSALTVDPANVGKTYRSDEIAGLGAAEQAIDVPFTEPKEKRVRQHRFELDGETVEHIGRPDKRAPLERTDRIGGKHTDRGLGRAVGRYVDDVAASKFVAPKELTLLMGKDNWVTIPQGQRLTKPQIRAALDQEPEIFGDFKSSLYHRSAADEARAAILDDLDSGRKTPAQAQAALAELPPIEGSKGSPGRGVGSVREGYRGGDLQSARGSISPEARRRDQTIRAAGFDPGAPIGTDITHEEAIAAGINTGTLPDPLGSKFTQNPASRAMYALKEAQKAYGYERASELLGRIRSAPEEEATRLAYEVAEGTVSRHMPNAESVSAVARRDAVHGVAQALLEGMGRRPATLPESVLAKDDAATAADLASGHLTERQLARPTGADDANAVRSLTEFAQPPRETRILPKPFARGLEADAAIGRQPTPEWDGFLLRSDDGPADVTVTPKKEYRSNVGGKTADELIADFDAGLITDPEAAKSIEELKATRKAFADHLENVSKGVTSGFATETPVAKARKKFNPHPETTSRGPTASEIGGDNAWMLRGERGAPADLPADPVAVEAATPDTPAVTPDGEGGKPIVFEEKAAPAKPKRGATKKNVAVTPAPALNAHPLQAQYEQLLAMAEASDGSDITRLRSKQAELDAKFQLEPNAGNEVTSAAILSEEAVRRAESRASDAKATQVGVDDTATAAAPAKPARGKKKPQPGGKVVDPAAQANGDTAAVETQAAQPVVEAAPEAVKTKRGGRRKPAAVAQEVAEQVVASDPALADEVAASQPAVETAPDAAAAKPMRGGRRKKPLMQDQGPTAEAPEAPRQESAPMGQDDAEFVDDPADRIRTETPRDGMGADGADIVDDYSTTAGPSPGAHAFAQQGATTAGPSPGAHAFAQQGASPAAAAPNPAGPSPGANAFARQAAGTPAPPPGLAARVARLATRNKLLTAAALAAGGLGVGGALRKSGESEPKDDGGWGLPPRPTPPPGQYIEEDLGVRAQHALRSIRAARREPVYTYGYVHSGYYPEE